MYLQELVTDLLVVGGGPAGLCAAIAAKKKGIDVLLVDEGLRLGGQLIKQTHMFFGSSRHMAGVRGIDIGRKLTEEVQSVGVNTLINTTVLGYYSEKVVLAQQGDKLFKISPRAMIVATGAQENFLAFKGNDLPGIYGAGAVQTLMNVEGVLPGKNGLMIGAGNIGLIVTYQLLQAGVNMLAVVEALPFISGYLVHASKIRRAGVPIYTSHTIVRAIGTDKVEKAVIAKLDDNFNPVTDTFREFEVDFVCLAVGLSGSIELLSQAGCELAYVKELGGRVALRNKYMETTVKGIFVAGDAAQIEEATSAMVTGKIAGLSAWARLTDRFSDSNFQKEIDELYADLKELRSGPTSSKILIGERKLKERLQDA